MKAGTSVIFLPCRDIEKTRHFYHEILGLSIEQKQGDNLYIFDTGYGYWGFVQYRDDRAPLSGPQGVCLSLNLKDDQAVLQHYEELKDCCEVFREPLKHQDFPVFSFFLKDPDGYLVEYQNVWEV